MASKSPTAKDPRWFAAIFSMTFAVNSCAAAPSNLCRETRMRLFWSRLMSIMAGARTQNFSLREVSRMAFAKQAAHSWRKMMCASPYCSSRIRSVREILFLESVLHKASFTPCQELGPTMFSMYTNTASKMARHSAWSGTLMASSSSVTAGYLTRRMGPSMLHGRVVLVPSLAGMTTSSTNMNCFQAAHHVWMSGRGTSELLITVGR
mmetsp:Transcript_8717/g.22446  ORF Transcript_8717/g.22446 Transcript_8717/m.22446 type:complete len:207 (+) Transcript_8717:669-1289(+)